MIYTAPINEVTWDDISAFCEQQKAEDSYLDYKKDFPDRLEATIAAMANTIGGVILIGIEESKDSKPKVPIAGVAFNKGLQERVTNIILSNVMPPVFPEIQVCSNGSGDRAIVVIRIHQSNQAPHAIAGNTRVYIRTGNLNNPEELARVDEIEWLKNRRQKSELLRESLFSRAKDRAARRTKPANSPWLTLALSPLYPVKSFMDPPGLQALRWDIQVENRGNTFPQPDYKSGVLAQESLIIEDPTEQYSAYTEMSVFGLYFSQQCLFGKHFDGDDSEPRMYLEQVLIAVSQLIGSGEKFYSRIGYWGPLWFRLQLDELHNHRMMGSSLFRLLDARSCRDPYIHISEILPNPPNESDKLDFLIYTAMNVAWCFGWGPNKESLKQYFEKLDSPGE